MTTQENEEKQFGKDLKKYNNILNMLEVSEKLKIKCDDKHVKDALQELSLRTF